MQAFKAHKTVDIAARDDTHCSTHNQHKQLYCHTCKKAVCIGCFTVGDCKGHEAEHVNSVKDEISKEMEQMKEQLQHTAQHLAAQLSNIDELMKSESRESMPVCDVLQRSVWVFGSVFAICGSFIMK